LSKVESMTIRPTRFDGLGYRQDGASLWRFYDTATGCAIGAQYKTKAELLAELSTFAKERGFDRV